MSQAAKKCGQCEMHFVSKEGMEKHVAMAHPSHKDVSLTSSEPAKTSGTGIKHDADKPDMSLLSSIAITEVAKVLTFGKKKYSAHNWRGGFAWCRPLAAALRHVFAFIGAEDNDPETGLSHLAHAICCLMFVLEFTFTKVGVDDRFKVEPKDRFKVEPKDVA